MKALELAKRSKQIADEAQLIHLCSSDEICGVLSADATELRRLAEVNAELLNILTLSRETIRYYASVCNEDDQSTPASNTVVAIDAAIAKAKVPG